MPDHQAPLVVRPLCEAVDILETPELSRDICDALGRSPVAVIVDLTDVEFLACTGIRVLLAAQKAADALSVRFAVVADGAHTSRPIRRLGLDATLALHPTLDDALHSLHIPPVGVQHTPT